MRSAIYLRITLSLSTFIHAGCYYIKDSKTNHEDMNVYKFVIPPCEFIQFVGADSIVYFDFVPTWNEFYKAMYFNDTISLISLVADTFSIRGPLDIDSTYLVSKTDFPKVFSYYLLPFGLSTFDSSLFATKRLFHTCAVTENWVSRGNFEFRKIDNEWKLTFIYTDYVPGSN
jgi:hypothetical protein